LTRYNRYQLFGQDLSEHMESCIRKKIHCCYAMNQNIYDGEVCDTVNRTVVIRLIGLL